MRRWPWQRLQPLLSSSSASKGFSVPWPQTRWVLIRLGHKPRESQSTFFLDIHLGEGSEPVCPEQCGEGVPREVCRCKQVWRPPVSPKHCLAGSHHNWAIFAGKMLANVRQGTSATCRWFDNWEIPLKKLVLLPGRKDGWSLLSSCIRTVWYLCPNKTLQELRMRSVSNMDGRWLLLGRSVRCQS